MNGSVPSPEASPRPREKADLHPGVILRVAGIFVATIAVALLALALLFHYFEHIYPARTSEAAPLVYVEDLPPAPRPQTVPVRDLQELRANEDLHLLRYTWVDRPQGIAQIPIDRAMSLWVQTQGATAAVSAPPSTNTPPVAPTELQMRQEKAKEAGHAP